MGPLGIHEDRAVGIVEKLAWLGDFEATVVADYVPYGREYRRREVEVWLIYFDGREGGSEGACHYRVG